MACPLPWSSSSSSSSKTSSSESGGCWKYWILEKSEYWTCDKFVRYGQNSTLGPKSILILACPRQEPQTHLNGRAGQRLYYRPPCRCAGLGCRVDAGGYQSGYWEQDLGLEGAWDTRIMQCSSRGLRRGPRISQQFTRREMFGRCCTGSSASCVRCRTALASRILRTGGNPARSLTRRRPNHRACLVCLLWCSGPWTAMAAGCAFRCAHTAAGGGGDCRRGRPTTTRHGVGPATARESRPHQQPSLPRGHRRLLK